MLAAGAGLLLTTGAWLAGQWLDRGPPSWSSDERRLMESLWIASLPPLPPDPTNAVADDPAAAAFGHALFFDPRASANGAIACATCHQPQRRFTDGLPRGVAIGRSARNTPSIVGAAYSPWYYWDGRRDSLWSQALSPLEDPNEHGSDRHTLYELVRDDPAYRRAYEPLFGPLPASTDAAAVDRVFANVGKAIAAYERRLLPGPSRFDAYVDHLSRGGDPRRQDHLDASELRGLRLFLGPARCTECHNGPLLTNHEFHNTGLLPPPGALPDRGRFDGLDAVRRDPFNCLGAFSDDPSRRCDELTFVRDGVELIGATRTPSLRNLGATMPFQSKGQFATLAEVLRHYNDAPAALIGHNEAKPLSLSSRELRDLEAFLSALDAPIAADPALLAAPRGYDQAPASGAPSTPSSRAAASRSPSVSTPRPGRRDGTATRIRMPSDSARSCSSCSNCSSGDGALATRRRKTPQR